MEQYYSTGRHGIDLRQLHDFFRQNGKTIDYQKGDQMEREGEQARWCALVEQGCFKYVTHSADNSREHVVWFSCEGEFVGSYPNLLDGRPSQYTIEAMMPSRVLRVSGERLKQFFNRNAETKELHCLISNHILSQFQTRCIVLLSATPRERYEMLLRRCPGITNDLPLNAIASFLNITPKTLSVLRRQIRGRDSYPPQVEIIMPVMGYNL